MQYVVVCSIFVFWFYTDGKTSSIFYRPLSDYITQLCSMIRCKYFVSFQFSSFMEQQSDFTKSTRNEICSNCIFCLSLSFRPALNRVKKVALSYCTYKPNQNNWNSMTEFHSSIQLQLLWYHCGHTKTKTAQMQIQPKRSCILFTIHILCWTY